MTAILLTPFLLLATAGFLASLVFHSLAVLGIAPPIGPWFFGLHIGIFVVWLPAVLAGSSLAGSSPRNDLWNATLRGCPPWMRRITHWFFFYAIFNFLLCIALTVFVLWLQAPQALDGMGVRLFSGHWMVFYGAAFAMMYSAIRISQNREAFDLQRHCPQGHTVSETAKFCETCGKGIAELPLDSWKVTPQQRLDRAASRHGLPA